MKIAPILAMSVPVKHDWHMWRGLNCCRQCGFIRNEKNAEAMCRGLVRVALREGVKT